ncbi:MAG TPA: asparaginase [Roseomonas sp.]|nr:asparaginase [Roseomonas sp.]
MSTKPKVAVIGTGGTISSMGRGPLDLIDYSAAGQVLDVNGVIARVPELALVAQIIPVPFRAIPSTALGWPEWKEMLLICDRLVAEHPDLAGIAITHGTASLEETAYFLSLTLKIPVPVVLVGAQRPASALAGDGPMNLVNAVRVAADPRARGLGALVLLNDEIQAAREVTKTSTLRLQTFRTPDFGCLGHADADEVCWYRRPLRRMAPDTEFDVRGLDALPRVDIAYAHAGADGTAIDAFVAAGARGIVTAGFAPGYVTPAMTKSMEAAVAKGVVVAMSSRAGSGRAGKTTRGRKSGFITADNLTPQKARILLSLSLAAGVTDHERVFATY